MADTTQNAEERMREIQLTEAEKYSRKNKRNTVDRRREIGAVWWKESVFRQETRALRRWVTAAKATRTRVKARLTQHLSLPAIALLRARE